jgi:hypothetical protein
MPLIVQLSSLACILPSCVFFSWRLFDASQHLMLLLHPQVMKNTDLAQRTRPRTHGAPVGQICAEVSCVLCHCVVPGPRTHGGLQSTAAIYSVYWPQMPLPGSVHKELTDSGSGIEMQPLKTAHASSVAVDMNADAALRDE